jgi:hypothetical protein
MPQTVAQLIQDWLDREDTKWDATPDVVAWAEAYGDDLERAWGECPRADFLMAIAGACKVAPELIVRASSAAAREAVTLLPAKVAFPRKAVHLAESYRVGVDLAETTLLIERTSALVDEGLDVEAARLRKAMIDAAPAASEAMVREATAMVVAASTLELPAQPDAALAAGEVPAEVQASAARMLQQALADKAVEKLRARVVASRRLLADAHAVRAAASSLVVASSASTAHKCAALVASIVKNERATDAVLLQMEEASRLARRGSARVYTESARVFEHAAAACGGVAATRDDAWTAAIAAILTGLMYAAVGTDLAAEDRGIPLDEALDAVNEQVKAAKLAQYADWIRAAIPRSAVRGPEDAAARALKVQQDPRAALLESLTALAPLTTFLDHPEAAEAMDLAIAILRASGPLDKKVLAQALRTVHERVEVMQRERASTATDAALEQARDASRRAAEGVREMDEVLAGFSSEKPS